MTSDAKFWDNIAEKYAAKPIGNPSAFARKQAIARELLPRDAQVIEIGCGTGSLALAMSAFTGHIHALDYSAQMIGIAKRKQQAEAVKNVTFQHNAIDQSSFPANTFDSAWAFSILHLLPDRPRVLAHLFDLLKPGGSLVISNVCLAGTWIPYAALIKLLHWFGKAPVVQLYDRATIQREIRTAGFVQTEERDVGAEKTVAFIIAKKPS